MSDTPAIRTRSANGAPIRSGGDYLLYWMAAARRPRWNFALQRAVERAQELGKPLIVLETLACSRRWDSDRLHRFVLEGMADNSRSFEGKPLLYYPHVARKAEDTAALVRALGESACAIVTDDFPAHEVPGVVARVAGEVEAMVELVDSNGLLPMRAAEKVFPTAYSFRRFLQSELRQHLEFRPKRDPLARISLPQPRPLPKRIAERWPRADDALLRGDAGALAKLPIDHSVPPVETRGGARAATTALRTFLRQRLSRYTDERNEPEQEVTSGLSPYLHYGHISAHQVLAELMKAEGWSENDLSHKATGGRSGWWGVSEPAEAFLDQLVTWRELGFNMAWQQENHGRYESLPRWAKETLADHAGDMRPRVYSFAQLEAGETYDALWNAAQMQLVREGRLHNYLRMLWGKKILEWTPAPEEAAEVMVALNDRYALDGQDPNSYSGIFWVLGRYDRPWGPERPIFGKVRYMSSENTARKIRVRNFIRNYGARQDGG